ncbi:ferredoxin--NADP+ reductase [Haloechinothrix alba]|uniref:ferredoxin--NADP(+) reductase n=1 Tax=Haloechinothrix alba TaxID=664784 RepID=A0A238X362_9PSEU|nr:FAD-dependent oxidoreductase [Haloechinothrix alba]SNR53110.1 ferredoxin--NADP+ reductase [Haloechinothrix alba]
MATNHHAHGTGTDRVGRVAVIGAGPAGLYTTRALVDGGATVDVFDRLPAPFGLVRYGVAPDHPRMKTVATVLQSPCATGAATYIGNVEVGSDVTLDQLRRSYHAVVYATGCPRDRALRIPGEGVAGSIGAGRLVGWYCGHPDNVGHAPPLDHDGAVVIGAGNVALDVARMLARSSGELQGTDVPDAVLKSLAASRVQDIHVLIRRGPHEAKFTPAELRQLGELGNADVTVHDDGVLAYTDVSDLDLRQRQNLQIMREWTARAPRATRRRIHLRFFRSPVELRGHQRLRQVVTERTRLELDRVVPAGRGETISAGLAVRAIGYQADPIEGLPFDHITGTVPNEAGRVLRDGAPEPGLYVAGWLKRGPTGVIGTNKADGARTASEVLADLPRLPAPPQPDTDALLYRLECNGVRYTDWNGWLRLNVEEQRLGSCRGADRVKIAERQRILGIARPPLTRSNDNGAPLCIS